MDIHHCRNRSTESGSSHSSSLDSFGKDELIDVENSIPFKEKSSPTTKQTVCRNKKVSFNKKVRVILIPTKAELKAAGVSVDIWWQPDDYEWMKASSAEELSKIMKQLQVDAKTALRVFSECPENYTDSASNK